uniref:Secreted protein n=1 Tax=Meloidogyne incognita TaxID=6306 RepID=A0A914M9F4_MELIC
MCFLFLCVRGSRNYRTSLAHKVVVPPTATHPRIIEQHPQPAFQHQTLGPPPGFEAPPLALRPGINVQTRPQSLFFIS